MEDFWKPDIVLLGPGGSRGLLEIGCLKRLFEERESENFLNSVKKWVGISVGSAISLLIVMGYKIEEITDICMDINLIDDITNISLDEARQKLGFLKNKTIEDKLKQLVNEKFGFIPSMQQLYNLTGVELCVVTFNLDKMRPEFFDKNSESEISCIEATMMSMAVPILMQPRKYKGCIYVDGALGAPYPVLKFDKDNQKILGIYISSEEDLFCSDKKPTNFLYRLIQSSMKVLRDNEIKYSSKNVKHISLKTLMRDTTGLSMDLQTRQNLIDQGYECANSFLKITSNPEKYDLNLSESEEIPFSF